MAAITGAVIAVGSAAYSIAQSEKQKTLAKQAQRDADKAFSAAEKELDVNYFEELGISKTPYDNQREALLVNAAQAMRQGQLSERGGAATAGQVLAQSNTSQQNVTDAQIKQTEALGKLVATEDSRLADERKTLQLAQAEGAGIASAQAQNASNASIQQGVTALANLGMQAYGNSELYNQNNTPTRDVNTAVTLTPTTVGSINGPAYNSPQLTGMNQPPIMSPQQQWMNSSVGNGQNLTNEQLLQLINP